MAEEQHRQLRAEQQAGGGWALVGPGAAAFALINDYLGYLSDRSYSPRTVRAYAFDLLAFSRWLVDERLALDAVTTDVLLRYLTACRTLALPSRPGDNVYSIWDGRNTGYAATTINRRLAAISGLFGYRSMRQSELPNPVPGAGKRGGRRKANGRGCSATSPSPRLVHACACASHAGSLVAWSLPRRRRCSAASAPCATAPSPGSCFSADCARPRCSASR